jgi:hypothetical protein
MPCMHSYGADYNRFSSNGSAAASLVNAAGRTVAPLGKMIASLLWCREDGRIYKRCSGFNVRGFEFMQEGDEGEDEGFWQKKFVSVRVSLRAELGPRVQLGDWLIGLLLRVS